MADDKPPMPAQPPTAKLPAMTDRALLEDLSRVVKDGFARTDRRFDALETAVDIQGNTVKDVAGRMSLAEQRIQRMEEDRRNDSMPAKLGRESQTNKEQDAVLAQHTATLEEHGKKLTSLGAAVKEIGDNVNAIKDAVTGFFTNKKVIFVGKVIFAAAMLYAGAKGIKVLP